MKLSTELVRTARNDIFTDSMIVAEKLGISHDNMLKKIKKIIKKLETGSSKLTSQISFFETLSPIKRGKQYQIFEMNEEAAMLIIMSAGVLEKVLPIRLVFIAAFTGMRKRLVQISDASWIQSRIQGKADRLIETDKIKEFVDYAEKQGATHAKFYYSNITKMTYRGLELLNHEKPIRETLSRFGHSFLGVAEDQVATALEEGMKEGLHYQAIFLLAKQRVEKLAELLPNKEKLLLS